MALQALNGRHKDFPHPVLDLDDIDTTSHRSNWVSKVPDVLRTALAFSLHGPKHAVMQQDLLLAERNEQKTSFTAIQRWCV